MTFWFDETNLYTCINRISLQQTYNKDKAIRQVYLRRIKVKPFRLTASAETFLRRLTVCLSVCVSVCLSATLGCVDLKHMFLGTLSFVEMIKTACLTCGCHFATLYLPGLRWNAGMQRHLPYSSTVNAFSVFSFWKEKEKKTIVLCLFHRLYVCLACMCSIYGWWTLYGDMYVHEFWAAMLRRYSVKRTSASIAVQRQ